METGRGVLYSRCVRSVLQYIWQLKYKKYYKMCCGWSSGVRDEVGLWDGFWMRYMGGGVEGIGIIGKGFRTGL